MSITLYYVVYNRFSFPENLKICKPPWYYRLCKYLQLRLKAPQLLLQTSIRNWASVVGIVVASSYLSGSTHNCHENFTRLIKYYLLNAKLISISKWKSLNGVQTPMLSLTHICAYLCTVPYLPTSKADLSNLPYTYIHLATTFRTFNGKAYLTFVPI